MQTQSEFLQDLQEPTCPTCGKPRATVYCSRLSDAEYRLLLRQTGRSQYTALHRVDTQLPPQ